MVKENKENMLETMSRGGNGERKQREDVENDE